MPYFSDRKIAIKSVPPLVALANRHRLMASALISPPKIAISRISSVTGYSCLMIVVSGILTDMVPAWPVT